MLENYFSLNRLYSRRFAGNGLWITFLLPICIIFSAYNNQTVLTPIYKFAGCVSISLLCNAVTCIQKFYHDQKLNFLDFTTVCSSFIFGFVFNNYFANDLCSLPTWIKSISCGALLTFIYIKIYCWLMRTIKYSFSLGEGVLVTQAFVIFSSCFVYNLYRILIYGSKITLRSNMQISTLIIQFGLFGILSLAFIIYWFNIKSPKIFYLTTFVTLMLTIILPLHVILNVNPIVWIFKYILGNMLLLQLFIYWFACIALTALVVRKQIKLAQKASTATRKIFHILAVLVYIPGLYYQCTFLYLASGVALGVFFMLEIIRIQSIPPLGKHLKDGFIVLKDEKDSGKLALSPIFLLAGLSLPLWIHPAPCDITDSAELTMLPLISGIVSVGVGDSAASFIGSKIGRFYWGRSRKTIEGTFANCLSQLIFIFFLCAIDFLPILSNQQVVIIILASTIVSIIEADTDQIDNIVLPLFLYILFI